MGWRRRLRMCLTSISPGGSGNRSGGHYDPCARSSLERAAVPARKRGPELKNAAVERREARRPLRMRTAARLASVPGGCASRSRGLANPGVFRRSAPLGLRGENGCGSLPSGFPGAEADDHCARPTNH